mgnify:CR=1 FL=1
MTLLYKGIKIFYKDDGQGTALVLLHGFLENSSMWDDFIPELTKKNRVIRIDLLGHGQTDCMGYLHSMELMADAAHAVIKHLRLRRFFLLGHSMGGYVALAYSVQHAKKLKGLCLMNSTYESDDPERIALRKKANKMVQHNFENMVRVSFSNLFTKESRSLYTEKFQRALKEALKTSVRGYMACQEGMILRKDLFMHLKTLDCKKLIILGKKDSVVDAEKIISQTGKTDIKTVVFSQGHMAHIENEKIFLQTLMHFIE